MYSLIVVDYNALDTTIEYICRCYDRLGMEGAGHTVIVENGSSEGTLERMRLRFGDPEELQFPEIPVALYLYRNAEQQICYCNSGANLGYAKGNNLGVNIAQAMWHDFGYIISNNDLVFEKDLDMKYINNLFHQNPAIGIVGPKVITPAGEIQSPRVWQSPLRRLFVTYWVEMLGSVLPKNAYSRLWRKCCFDTDVHAESGPCDWLMGCFFFARADIFHKAGLFDEHTFLYAEEMILSKRLEAVGAYPYFCAEQEIIHNHGQTTRSAISAIRVKELDLNANCYFYETYWGCGKFTILAAKLNFKVYKAVFMLWQKVKSHLKRKS